MNKAIGVGIGVAALVIAFVFAGGSTILEKQDGLPSDDQNTMLMGDKVSIKVTPSEETNDEEITEEEISDEEVNEGKSLEVNLVDGVSATSTP